MSVRIIPCICRICCGGRVHHRRCNFKRIGEAEEPEDAEHQNIGGSGCPRAKHRVGWDVSYLSQVGNANINRMCTNATQSAEGLLLRGADVPMTTL